MERLVRLWFGFATRIDRRTYVVSGVVLMLVEYLLDATVAWGVTGEWWSPGRYLVPLWSVRMAQFQPAPSELFLWLGLMTLPFFWIGVSMSVRRAADAGLPPFLGLGFAIPGVTYLRSPGHHGAPVGDQPHDDARFAKCAHGDLVPDEPAECGAR